MASLLCSCCKQPKDSNSLSVRKSTIMPGHNLILCQGCKEKKHEPRWLIVVASRSLKELENMQDSTAINGCIRNHLYCGKTIEASEIVP